MALTARSRRALVFVLLGTLTLAHRGGTTRANTPASPGAPAGRVAGQEEPARPQTFTIVARKYSFSPSRIEVARNDLVKITLVTEDIPHSFTVDAYRIAKRAAPHQSVTFEFRADQAGDRKSVV